MANVIRIKRSTGTTAPESLANAELAYSEGGDALYIGVGTGGAGGSATTIKKIGSNGLFSSQTATYVYAAPNAANGSPSFRSLVVGDISGLSTDLASKANLNGATFSGAVTFNSTVALGSATATTQATSDNSTKVATTAFVKSLGYSTTTGTVTSVGVSLPGIFTVTGSPVTSSGTITASLTSQTARQVFAAPTAASGAPVFRALEIADVPNLQTSLDAKAATAGATFSGGVTFNSSVSLGASATATTPATSSNTTAVATTAFVKAQGYSTTTGTVTSVGLSLPGIFSVSGSPVSSTGTLGASFVTQASNTIFAGPAGGNGTPSFRSLVAADIPTITASKVSDFNTQVRTSRLDQMAAPTADVSLNNRKITSLAEPTAAQDAATKAYVDAVKTGLDFKDSVKAATTANITLSAAQTIDGVALTTGDRVLVKNQSTGSQNGIYTVASGAWARAGDFDSNVEVTSGAFVFVEQGTVNADSGWVLSTDGAITVGTTAIVFTQFSGAGQIVDGAGLSKTGNTLNVVAGTGITVAGDSVALTGRALALHNLTTTGFVVQTGAGTYAGRSVAVSGSGISISNGDGTAGNPTVSLTAALSSIGGLTPAADRLPYYTGASTASLATFTAFGRSLVDDANAAAARSTLGLGTAATSASTAFQPADTELTALAGLTSAADRLPYFTGSGTASLATFSAFGRSLVDDANAAAARTTLALGSMATQNSNAVSVTGGTISGITLDNVTIDGGTW
jgi:hypothetical protein